MSDFYQKFEFPHLDFPSFLSESSQHSRRSTGRCGEGGCQVLTLSPELE